MSNQVQLTAQSRPEHGKGASGRIRKQGRVPGILYGFEVEPTALSVDALELYHALRTEAGLNALIQLKIDGETYLSVARDLQHHPIKGDTLHVDFLAVDRTSQISVEVPVHIVDEDEAANDSGVINQILYTVPILVRPLDVPNYFELSVKDMEIGDVKRVEDLADQLPDGAELDIELERTVVTDNPPVSDADLEALEESAGVEAEEPELVGAEEDTKEEG